MENVLCRKKPPRVPWLTRVRSCRPQGYGNIQDNIAQVRKINKNSQANCPKGLKEHLVYQ